MSRKGEEEEDEDEEFSVRGVELENIEFGGVVESDFKRLSKLGQLAGSADGVIFQGGPEVLAKDGDQFWIRGPGHPDHEVSISNICKSNIGGITGIDQRYVPHQSVNGNVIAEARLKSRDVRGGKNRK